MFNFTSITQWVPFLAIKLAKVKNQNEFAVMVRLWETGPLIHCQFNNISMWQIQPWPRQTDPAPMELQVCGEHITDRDRHQTVKVPEGFTELQSRVHIPSHSLPNPVAGMWATKAEIQSFWGGRDIEGIVQCERVIFTQ